MPLHRPYIRSSVRAEVEKRAQKNEKGQFLDANTGQAIEGQYDLGHKPGHEHWREAEKAEKEGLTQEQFNDRMNNPDYYQIEDPHENRSHVHEQPKDNPRERGQKPTQDATPPQATEPTQRGHLPEEPSKIDSTGTNSATTEASKAAEEAAKKAAEQETKALSSATGMGV